MDASSPSLRKYGLTQGDHDEMVESQNGQCMICNTDQPGTQSGCWPVDHDHATGRVRALLCSACNAGLGLSVDDPARLGLQTKGTTPGAPTSAARHCHSTAVLQPARSWTEVPRCGLGAAHRG